MSSSLPSPQKTLKSYVPPETRGNTNWSELLEPADVLDVSIVNVNEVVPGLGDALAEGVPLGLMDGDMLGDGVPLGLTEGLTLGVRLGETEGLTLGVDDGLTLGVSDGLTPA